MSLEVGTSSETLRPAWHCQSVNDVAKSLEVDLNTGLDAESCAQRLTAFGPNDIEEQPSRSILELLVEQFRDFMIVILLAAAVVSGLVGDLTDTIAIVVIVVLNAAIGVTQAWRAERAIAALKRIGAPRTRVLRQGHVTVILAGELVPGDIVLLEAGDVVPADLRLFELHNLSSDESMLTGESAVVEKQVEPLTQPDLPLGDRTNMVFKGTVLTYGRGRGIAVATGMRSELGKIAALLDRDGDTTTPLQKRLAAFGRRLGIAILVVCAVILLSGLMRGEAPLVMFLTAVSLAVAAVPEALPAVVTILLALGARKMVQENALIRRLPAVETLGSVTYICSDKTGTLTQNKMTTEMLYADGVEVRPGEQSVAREPWSSLILAMALCNDAEPDDCGGFVGDPTETALAVAARGAFANGVTQDLNSPRLFEIPFSSERKRMTTVHRIGDDFVAFVKGAPETILARSVDTYENSSAGAFDRDEALKQADLMAENGLRVLAFAMRRFPSVPDNLDHEAVEKDLTFLGFAGLIDPPRENAKRSVDLCRTAGITPVMITGDHPKTACAIAKRLDIFTEQDRVMSGRELAELSEAEFRSQLPEIKVFARVDPAQKIRIVEALQAQGEFVAMTGDGVNDAPALSRADIGVAMGREGTDVAREAASLVLLDDNFSTIVAAVREGRRIYDNIRKFIKYTMTSNAGEVLTIFLAPFFGLPIPLLPIHILWINLVTDGLPGLALTAEKVEPGVMDRAPRAPTESIFAHGMWQHIVWCGLTLGLIAIASQAWAIGAGNDNWQTIVFTVLTFSQMGHVLAIRSDESSLFSQGLMSNKALLGAVALTFILQLCVIYIPFLNPIFHTSPLSAGDLLFCLALSVIVFVLVEIEKVLVRCGWLYRESANSMSES